VASLRRAIAGAATSVAAFVSTGLAQSSPDSTFAAWARGRLTPLGTITDSTPIPGLSARLRRAAVIGVGESVHEVHEFLLLRARLLRQMVAEAQVTSVALESGLPEGRAVDDYVTGKTDTVDFTAALKYGFGELSEVRQVFRWLRAWNAGPGRSRPVHVYGVDLASSAGSMLPALDPLLALLERVDRAEAARLRESLRPLAARASGAFWRPAALRYDSLTASERATLRTEAARLPALALRHRAKLGHEDADWAHRLARVAQQFEEMLRLGAYHLSNPRDRAMAENTFWVLGRQPAGGRVVLWAHNAHVQRVEISGPASPASGPVTTMGLIIGRRLGSRYLAIGTSYGGPSLDSATVVAAGGVDRALGDLSARSPFLLDLSGAPPTVRPWLDRPRPIRFQVGHLMVPLGRAFDLVGYFEVVERATR
jgi:erythromycin esterase